MKLTDFYQIADELAPKRLSDEYCAQFGAYDNSGILLDAGEDIKKVLFSLDFSFDAVERAVKEGANLIVTHHPAIYQKIGDLRVGDFDPLDRKIIRCLRAGISVISMHLNLDLAKDGIDENLATGIAGSVPDCTYMHELTDGAYGRAYEIAPTSLKALAERIKRTFQTERLLVYGKESTPIRKVTSFCGSGADEESVAFACREKADAIVSSDFKHHIVALALESGLSVIALTHYASEAYGFEKYYKKISQKVGLPCIYHTDETLF